MGEYDSEDESLMILRAFRTHVSGFLYVGGRRAPIQLGLNLRDALKLDFKVLCLLRR
jgi:hypothetical protein